MDNARFPGTVGGVNCGQHGCENDAAFRYTWPGRDESGICLEHAPKLIAVARAIDLHLQLIPIGDAARVLEFLARGARAQAAVDDELERAKR